MRIQPKTGWTLTSMRQPLRYQYCPILASVRHGQGRPARCIPQRAGPASGMEDDGCSRRYRRVSPASHGISPVLAPIHPAIHPQIGVHENSCLSTPSYSPTLRLYHALAALLFTYFLHLYILCGLLHAIHLFARTFASCLSTCPCRTRSHRLRRIRDRCRPETRASSGSRITGVRMHERGLPDGSCRGWRCLLCRHINVRRAGAGLHARSASEDL